MTFCGNRYFLEGRPDDMVGVAAGTVEPFTEPEVVVLGPYESQDVERSGVDTRTIGTEDAIYWFYKNRLFRTSLPTTQ